MKTHRERFGVKGRLFNRKSRPGTVLSKRFPLTNLEELEARALLAVDSSALFASALPGDVHATPLHTLSVRSLLASATHSVVSTSSNGSSAAPTQSTTVSPAADPALTTSSVTDHNTSVSPSVSPALVSNDAPTATPSVGDGTTMSLTLQAEDLGGHPISTIAVGQQFLLAAMGQDTTTPTPAQAGVFSAYMNVAYASNLGQISPAAKVTLGNFNLINASTVAARFATIGQISQLGVISGQSSGPGTAPELLWTVPVTATGAGSLTFQSSFDATPGHDTLDFSSMSAMTASQISFGSASITVTAANAPVVELNAPNTTFTTAWNNSGAVAIASNANASITDAGSANLSSMTVALASPHAGDVLAATGTGNVSASFNSTSGVLLLTGTDTLANYLTVLKSVTYNNTSGGPGVTSELVSVSANDGTAVSNFAVATLNTTSPPVVLLNAPNANFTTTWSNSGAVAIAGSNAAINDTFSSTLASMTVTLSTHVASDTLSATGTGSITVTPYNTSTGVLLLTGTDTLANYLTVLKSVTYNSAIPGPHLTPELATVTVNDGTSASALSTATININSPPVVLLNSPGTNFTTNWNNNAAVAISSGPAITDGQSSTLSSMTVTLASPHAGDVLSAVGTGSVTVTPFNSTTGVLLLSGSDTLADYLTVLGSVTYNNTLGGPKVASEAISVLANDGIAASNTATAMINITNPVLRLNAPATNFSTTWTNGGAVGITNSTNATLTDPESTTLSSMTVTLASPHTGDVLSATGNGNVTVTAFNSTTGVLLLTGSDTLDEYLTVLNSVTYNNTVGGPGVSSESVSVVANDGIAISAPATASIAISVPPIVQLNAPNTNFTTGWNGNGAVAIASSANASITDGESANLTSMTVTLASPKAGDTLSATGVGGVTVTAFNSTTGVLLLTGSDTLADYLTVLKSITYNNTLGGPQVATETISVVANDGVATSATATSTIDVGNPIVLLNAPNTNFTTSWTNTGAVPIASGTTASITDGESANLTSLTVTLASPHTGDVLTATPTGGITVTAFNSTTGVLLLTGSDTLANYLTVLKSVVYNNTAGGPGVSSETVNVVANDGSALSRVAVTTINVNVPPVVQLNAPSANFASSWVNGGAVPIANSANASIVDGESANLTSMTVTLAGPQAGDTLSATAIGGITVTAFNSTTGLLLLSGSDTLADYLTVLKSITYDNTLGGPPVAAETIDVVANDGTNVSNTAVATINVNVPVVKLNTPSASFTTTWTNGGAVGIASSANATIVDGANANLTSMTVTLASPHTGDILSATGTTGITVTPFNATTGVLLLTGSDTLADYLTVLKSITYNNTAGGPGVGIETVSVVANDGELSSSAVTATIDVNVAPVVLLNAPNANFATNWTNSGAVAIASSANASITDGESGTLTSMTVTLASPHAGDTLSATATGSITVTAFNATTGVLLLTGSDTLADYLTVLKSITYDNTSGGPQVGTETISVVANDGTNTSSAAVSTVTINVPIVLLNAPDTNFTNTWSNSGAVAIASSANASITDSGSSTLDSMTITLVGVHAGDTLSATATGSITVTAFNATTGVLLLSGSDTLADYLTVLKSITYDNTSGGPKVGSETIDVVANDGFATSHTAVSTININAPPVVQLNAPSAGFTTTWSNSGAVGIASSDNASITDGESANLTSMTITLASPHAGDTLAATGTGNVSVTAFNSTTGVLLLSGSDTLADYLTVLKSVTYNNTSGGPGVASEAITVVANDGTAASAAATATVNVNAPPILQLNAPSTNFSTTWTNGGAVAIASSANASITDGESGTLTSMTVTLASPHAGDTLSATATGSISITAFNSTTGVLLLSGSDTLADYLTVLKSITYNNTAGGPGVASEAITVVANDGTAASAAATSTVGISVAPVVLLNAPATNFTTSWTDTGAVAIADGTNASITDGESATLSSMTITLASPQTGDTLSATATGSISVTAFNSTTGVLVLTGSDTLADYLTVLKSITYNNTAGGPPVASEAVSVVANDGSNSSAVATTTINIGGLSSLSGAVLVNTGHVGLAGVTVTLTGTTTFSGAPINQSTTTASDGTYSFNNLSAGTYTITFTQPSKFETGTAVVGNQGGTASNNSITVTLGASSVQGTGYDFDIPGLNADQISQRLLLASTPNTTPSVTTAASTLTSPNVTPDATSSVSPLLASAQGGGTFSLNRGTLTVQGTAGDDVFSFTEGSQMVVTLNGVTHSFALGSVTSVVFVGGGGHDTATLTGSSGNDVAKLGLGSGTLTGSHYTVSVNGVESITVNGGGGNDTATLTDTALGAFLQASGDSASLSSDAGFVSAVAGFAQVKAVASGSGNDTAHVSATDFALSEVGSWTST